jgi:hypothetical protein
MGKHLLGTLIVMLAGCVSYPPPSETLTNSTAAARGAEEAGAQQIPAAALHVQLADEQNAAARRLMEQGDNREADFMAQRAQSDADMALALAHQQAAETRANQARAAAQTGAPQAH